MENIFLICVFSDEVTQRQSHQDKGISKKEDMGIHEGGIQQKRRAIQSQDYPMYQKSLKVEL